MLIDIQIDDLHEVLLNQVNKVVDAFDQLEFLLRYKDVEQDICVLLYILNTTDTLVRSGERYFRAIMPMDFLILIEKMMN